MADSDQHSPSDILRRDLEIVANHIREGRFQRSLALLTAATSIVSGLEVAYEHYRGSYSRRVMYTPVILSVLLAAAGIAGFFSRRAARTVLRLVSAVTLVDAGVGFYFHVRGIKRKPGGWRLADDQHDHGAADLRSAAVRHQRLPWARSPPICSAKRALAPCPASGKDTFLARLLPSRREPRIALRRAGHARRTISAPGRHRHRHQRAAQRLRGVLLALQKQLSLLGAVDADRPRAAARGRCLCFGEEPPAGDDRACRRCRCWPARTPPSASTTTAAACFAARRAASICSTTSCTGRRSSLRCSLARRECSACSPACCGGSAA